jgi:hypothetical protein
MRYANETKLPWKNKRMDEVCLDYACDEIKNTTNMSCTNTLQRSKFSLFGILMKR